MSAERMSAAVELLRTSIQPYAWGSTTAIPAMLGVAPTGGPQAEMWIGAHPVAPSHLLRDGVEIGLDEAVGADPDGELGVATARRFGRFPFLLKVLAASAPLSLQAHPSAAGARAGFAAEDAAGIARDAPDRNYRDDWPKPEIACALTPFRALAGFRDPAGSLPALRALAAAAPESALTDLAEGLGSTADPAGAIARALRSVLELRGEDRAALAATVVAAARNARARADADAELLAELDFVGELAAGYPGDPSVLAALLLNRFTLAPGEAVFLPAGNLHAYLSGTAVELMASSDNVLRGGLTTKHVDVPELLSVLDTTPRPADVVRPVQVSDHEFSYPTPTREFGLSRLELSAGGSAGLTDPGGPQLLLCVGGAAVVTAGGVGGAEPVILGSGRAAYARAGCGDLVVTGNPAATVFRATPGAD